MRAFAMGIVVSIAFAAPAKADWQYTKWGMTPAQVLTASGGQATCKTLSAKEIAASPSLLLECSGWYQVGKFKFIALFGFDKQDHQLQEVTLSLANVHEEDDLSQAMQENMAYGQKELFGLTKLLDIRSNSRMSTASP